MILAATFSEVITQISSWLWGVPMIVLLLGTHFFLTIRLKFPQRYIFKAIKLSFTRDKGCAGDVSPFSSLATSLAATIGTGNIIGVGTAIALGGPGAVFWCWLTGLLGIATKYGEGILAVKYRIKTSDGSMIGGPMYALEKGLKMKWLAVLLCFFTVIAALGIGNTIQSNAIASLLSQEALLGSWFGGIPKHITGVVLAIIAAPIILLGIKGVARFCALFVPFMGILYVGSCLIILGMHVEVLGATVSTIFTAAFSQEAVGGGLVGGGLLMAIRYGVARGLFSNESGLGSAPILAAAARTRNPVRQALVSASGTFWDTVIVCAITGLTIVSTLITYPDLEYTQGAELTQRAFAVIPYFGSYVLVFGIITFSFSTILGWGYYAEKAMEYLGGKRVILYYRLLWVILIFVGANADLNLVWSLADVANALMAIPNLIALLLLSGIIVAETKKYLWSNRLDENSEDVD